MSKEGMAPSAAVEDVVRHSSHNLQNKMTQENTNTGDMILRSQKVTSIEARGIDPDCIATHTDTER